MRAMGPRTRSGNLEPLGEGRCQARGDSSGRGQSRQAKRGFRSGLDKAVGSFVIPTSRASAQEESVVASGVTTAY
jgi:hypothetical protein